MRYLSGEVKSYHVEATTLVSELKGMLNGTLDEMYQEQYSDLVFMGKQLKDADTLDKAGVKPLMYVYQRTSIAPADHLGASKGIKAAQQHMIDKNHSQALGEKHADLYSRIAHEEFPELDLDYDQPSWMFVYEVGRSGPRVRECASLVSC